MPPGIYTPVWPKTDIEILLERIEKLETMAGIKLENIMGQIDLAMKTMDAKCPACLNEFKVHL